MGGPRRKIGDFLQRLSDKRVAALKRKAAVKRNRFINSLEKRSKVQSGRPLSSQSQRQEKRGKIKTINREAKLQKKADIAERKANCAEARHTTGRIEWFIRKVKGN